jgi:hypothetical protein
LYGVDTPRATGRAPLGVAPAAGSAGSLPNMETPPPDPQKLLAHWMEWERGETPPGRVMSSLKTGGMREVLEALVAQTAGSGADAGA